MSGSQDTGIPQWAFVVAVFDVVWTFALGVVMAAEATSHKIPCLNTHPPQVCGNSLAIWTVLVWIGGMVLLTTLGVLLWGVKS